MPIRPTLRQLQLFAAAARHRSFKEAAAEMCLSPSALSIQLKQLESEVGLPLFEQIGKRKFLTAAGRELRAGCLRLLHELEDIDMQLARMKGGISGPLRISVVTSAKFFTPHLMGAFHRRFPDVKLHLTVANRNQNLERLLANQDDLVIMAHVPEGLPTRATPFLDNPLIVIAPAEHPLAGRKRIPLGALSGMEFLVRENGSGTRMAMEEIFEREGVEVINLMELGSSEAVKQGVIAGLGLSVLSRHCVWLELRSGYIRELDIEGFPEMGKWYAVHMPGKRLSPPAAAFLDFIVRNGERMLAAIVERYHGP